MTRDVDVDVAIVGAGLTGLWTALQLRRRQPDCRIAVVESRIAGFGASGRNGGWCSALFPASSAQLAAMAGEDAARALHRAMIDTVTQVGHDIAELGIDCHWARGGTLTLATNPAHVGRLRGLVSESRRWGFGEDDLRWLTPAEASERVRTPALFGATFTPHCAAVQPAMLVRQLARRVESRGVAIYEGSPVREIGPGYADCAGGRVRADVVLRCTEGYTPALRGHGRDVVPIYSMLIATETLSDAGMGRDRARRSSDVLRRTTPAHLRPAHRRRTPRLRWSGGAVSLRVPGRGPVRPRRVDRGPAHRDHARAVPGHAPAPGHPPLGRPAGGAPRLVRIGRPRPGQRPRMGRWLRRRRCVHHPPRRSHAGGPGVRHRQRRDQASLGEPPVAPLGTRAAAMARCERGPHRGCRRPTDARAPDVAPRSDWSGSWTDSSGTDGWEAAVVEDPLVPADRRRRS